MSAGVSAIHFAPPQFCILKAFNFVTLKAFNFVTLEVGRGTNVVSLEWRVTCHLLSASQTPVPSVGQVAAAAFGLLAAVFFMKLGFPVGVMFLGSEIERNQKTE